MASFSYSEKQKYASDSSNHNKRLYLQDLMFIFILYKIQKKLRNKIIRPI